METILVTAFRRLRPRFGWLSFVLLALMVATLLGATLEVGWVPQAAVGVPLAMTGFILAALLAHSSFPPVPAWLALAAAGLALSVALLANLRPPRLIWSEGGQAVMEFTRQRLILFGDRVMSWVEAVGAGESSTETMAFALGLALAAWLVAAFLAWSVYRINRPLAGISVAGFAIALTGYFGQAPLYWSASFIGLAVTAAAALHYGGMEATWERLGIDFSSEIKGELLIAAAFTGMLLMSLAFALPSVNVRAIAEAFRGQPAILEAESALERAFAGVEQPRLDDSANQAAASRPAGVLPRAFLLGAGPELLETVVMTASVAIAPAGGVAASPDAVLANLHWRGASYDIYTGRGWQRSGEREQNVPANDLIDQTPESPSTHTVHQTIAWAANPLQTRYTLGLPVTFDHDTTTYWRGDDDLSRVTAAGAPISEYQATSRVTPLDEPQLRETNIDDVPRLLLSRYTDLPGDVPRRVYDLARDVALSDPDASPFDQARAIEHFLRQYPYSLDIPLPPPGVEMTDYFLFDLQRGFCDYYATAMVVMARSIGLPARLGTGFLQTSPTGTGEQLIRQNSAHSWAEIYFPGHGWVEFEPTTATAAPEAPIYATNAYSMDDGTQVALPPTTPTVALPNRAPQRDVPWPLLIVVAVLGGLIIVLLVRRFWRRRQAITAGLDAVESAYALLQQQAADLGIMTFPGETPFEFAESFSRAADQLWLGVGLPDASPRRQVERVATLYAVRRYAFRHQPTLAPPTDEALELADGLRSSLRRLRWQRLRAYLRRPRESTPHYEVRVTNSRYDRRASRNRSSIKRMTHRRSLGSICHAG